MDLNGFKLINDRLGHEAGDQMLRHVAQALQATLRASDTVCRMGGDEFVIVANGISHHELDGLMQKIADAIALPLAWEGHILSVRASIGTSLFPDDGDTPETLVRKADAAMYCVKRARLARKSRKDRNRA
jgi:diguanylate cyclase (GGDEF)-like protein